MSRSQHIAVALLVLLAGCEDAVGPGPTTSTENPTGAKAPARIVVVNTNSETLSNLDPSTGEMTVLAAYVGTWANRISVVPGGSSYLVAASGDNEVQIIDAWNLSLKRAIDAGPASNPWLALAWDWRWAVVTNWTAGNVRILDLAAGSAGPAVPTSAPGPEGIAVCDGRAYVACTNFLGAGGSYGEGRVDVVDLAAGSVVASLNVGMNPQDVIVATDGLVHVLCTGNYPTSADPVEASVYRIDPLASAVVDSLAIGGWPGRFAQGPPGEIWAVGWFGGVRRYSSEPLARLPAPPDPELTQPGFSAIAWDPATTTMYVTHFELDLLVAIDAVSLAVRDSWLVGDGPTDVIVSRP